MVRFRISSGQVEGGLWQWWEQGTMRDETLLAATAVFEEDAAVERAVLGADALLARRPAVARRALGTRLAVLAWRPLRARRALHARLASQPVLARRAGWSGGAGWARVTVGAFLARQRRAVLGRRARVAGWAVLARLAVGSGGPLRAWNARLSVLARAACKARL